MNTLLNRLFLWQKFVLLSILGVLLLAAPLVLYINESQKVIDSATLDAKGIAPIRAVLKVVLFAQQHRGLSAMVLAGNDAVEPQRAAKQKEVDDAFVAAASTIGNIADNTGNATVVNLLRESKDAWTPLAGKVAQRSLPGPQSFAQHTALITQLLKINELLIDHFKLHLDSGSDSYYLIDAALIQSPMLMETLGRMRARGSAILTSKSLPPDDRALLMSMLERIGERYESVNNALQKAIAANPPLKAKLGEPLQASLSAGSQLIQLTQQQIVNADELAYPGPNYFAKVTDTIGAQVRLYDAAIGELETILHARRAELTYTENMLIGAILMLALLTGLAGYFISRSITVPLAEAVSVAKRVAAGDLTAQIDASSSNELGQLLQALKHMNDSLLHVVAEVRSGTDAIATASGQITAGNVDLSSRTEQQASSLEETASSMEEITGTVRQNADNARQANQLASSATEVAAKGGTMVMQVVATMGSINESSKRIADIIGVIDGITFQTNILALNAAVEAARAGEQGRGFAVVASEVRSLAQRSATAAREIKELISDSVEKVDAGARLVDQTGATMGEIVGSIKRVSDIIGEISAASDEQASGIEQINLAIGQMDHVTQQNAALVEEAAAAAESLKVRASNLAQTVSVFKIDRIRSTAAVPYRATRLAGESRAAISDLNKLVEAV